MEYMTAEQAAEAARGLTFEKVWAALMETRQRMEESSQRMEESYKRLEESDRKLTEQLNSFSQNMEKSRVNMEKTLGGLGNSLGKLTEALYSAELCQKFNEYGYQFNIQTNRKKYYENKNVLAEVDSALENGEYIMLVEIKTELSSDHVDWHLERIQKIRRYMDAHHDTRKIIGTVAGGIIPENVLHYAHRKGLFVAVQNVEAVSVAKAPEGFAAREW